MLDSLDDEKSNIWKKEGSKRKKEKRDNLDDNEKQFRKYKKKERTLFMIAFGVMRKNKSEKKIRKERWINVYKL